VRVPAEQRGVNARQALRMPAAPPALSYGEVVLRYNTGRLQKKQSVHRAERSVAFPNQMSLLCCWRWKACRLQASVRGGGELVRWLQRQRHETLA